MEGGRRPARAASLDGGGPPGTDPGWVDSGGQSYGSDWDRRQAAVRPTGAPEVSWLAQSEGAQGPTRPENRTMPMMSDPMAARAGGRVAAPPGDPRAEELAEIMAARAAMDGRTARAPRPQYPPQTGAPRERVPRPAAPAPPPSGEPPAESIAGNKLLVVIGFWALLVTSVALWWFNNPVAEVRGSAEIFTAVGRITGLIAGYLLMVQILMMSRVSWLENWVGGHDLMRWHRRLGAYLLVMTLSHAGYTTVGYALTENVTVVEETVTLWNDYEDMVQAFIATGLMVAISAVAIRAARRRLPYELWHLIHMATYAILILGYGHQFASGNELARDNFARWFWMGLYALTIACLFWGRVVEPLWVNLRHRLEVVDVVPESGSMVSIYVGGRALDRIEARAGQYFRWRFMAADGWWQSHPFSLSAAPNRQWLRLTVTAVGRYTSDLRSLRPGTKVLVSGPSGTFTASHRTTQRALLIAGGSGIAPIRALLEELPPGTVVIYRATGPGDIVFNEELRGLAQKRGFTLRYVLGSRNEPGPRRLFTPEGLRELVPDVRQRDVYLCGPAGMVETAVSTLRELKVKRRQIHLDPFEF